MSVLDLPPELLGHISTWLTGPDSLRWVRTCKGLWRKRWRSDWCSSVHSAAAEFFYYVLDLRQNAFLTGGGGTGKSYLLRRMLKLAAKHGFRVAATASTGMASLHLPHGQTLHSFAGVGRHLGDLEQVKERVAQLQKEGRVLYPQFTRIDILVIDEISMVGSTMLDILDVMARHARQCPEEAFGGLQVVFCGDFLQLPPVGDHMAFLSAVWPELHLHEVLLTHIHRQASDNTFMGFVSRLRQGKHTDKDLGLLRGAQQRFLDLIQNKTLCDTHCEAAQVSQAVARLPPRLQLVCIFARHYKVAQVNEQEFRRLPGDIEEEYQCVDKLQRRTDWGYVDTDEMTVEDARALSPSVDHRIPPMLRFKKGAQYILTKNINTAKGLVNGARCVYRSGDEVPSGQSSLVFKNGICLPLSATLHVRKLPVQRTNGELFISREQLALRLGYAITIHSSQGMTLDAAVIDLGREVTVSNQAHVAVSRVKSRKGLYLSAFDERSLRTHKAAQQFYEKMARRRRRHLKRSVAWA